MLSRGDKIRHMSGRLATLFEELSRLRYKLDTNPDAAFSDPDLTEELFMFLYDSLSREDINSMLGLFKEIYNSPNITFDDTDSIYKNIIRS